MKFGFDPIKVMEYTPYEITLISKQQLRKNQEDFERDLTLAWHIEAFARQKKLPSFEKILKDARRPRRKEINKSDEILKRMAAEKGVIIK